MSTFQNALVSMQDVTVYLHQEGYKKIGDGVIVAAFIKGCPNGNFISILADACKMDVLNFTITTLNGDLTVLDIIRPPDSVFQETLRGIEVRQLATSPMDHVA